MRPSHFTDEDRQVRGELLTQHQSHQPRARVPTAVFWPHIPSLLCPVLPWWSSRALGSRTGGSGTGLLCDLESPWRRGAAPWSPGEGRRVRVSEGGPHNSASCLLAPSPCSLRKLMLGRTLRLRRPPSTTFISCSLTFLSGQVKTPLTRAQESRAASASAKTGIEPSAPAFPFWHRLQTG